MAYSNDNLKGPFCQNFLGGTPQLWMYKNVDGDTDGTQDTTGYFATLYSRGGRAGDWILSSNMSTFSARIFIVNGGTSDATIDVTDGLAIAATDTD